MAVTELAILPLSAPLTKEASTLPPALIQKLMIAKDVLEKSAGYPFHYFQQIEDPSLLYLLGRWDSVGAHHAFLPSEENQKLLELLKDDIVMTGDKKMQMWHLGTDIFSIPSDEEKSVFEAPVISCNRHFVSKEKKAGFIKKFEEVEGLLEDFTAPYQVVGGWRIEREMVEGKESEEWVLFIGFESVEHHHEFAKMEGFEKYREIVQFVEGFEVRHLTVVEGL